MHGHKNEFQKQLVEQFKTEERIGIKNIDYHTGLTEEEFKKAGFKQEFEGVSTLPDGKNCAICTNNADYVVALLGEGDRYGFMVEDNPSVTDDEIISSGGHDFAVIRKRFIVDLWISHYTGCDSQVVFDLKDPKDSEKIKAYFGDPDCWDCDDLREKRSYPAGQLPEDKVIPRYKLEDTSELTL